jgi:hypothetical protein
MKTFVERLTPSLFWDIDVSDLDESMHRQYIIQRVLERGNLSDWNCIKQHYSIKVIVEEAQRMKSLDPKALAFIACVGDVPKESFRCTITQ